LYIVNIAVRLLVLAFVFVGGAVTFAGPQINSAPVSAEQAADMQGASNQKAPASVQSPNTTSPQDLG